MSEKLPLNEMADYIKNLEQDQSLTTEATPLATFTADQPLPAPTASLAPAAAPVAPEAMPLAPSTPAAPASPVARPLTYFTTPAKEVTKKQSVYLPVELHRALATVVNLPGVEVSLSDLLANIVQAWRDDHRAEVRKRYREGEKGI